MRNLPALLLILLLLTGCGGQGGNDEALAQGRTLYEANCAGCHGVQGEGQPNWQQPGPDGSLPAPPHDASGHTWHHPDALLLRIIAEGGQMPDSAMPAFGDKLTPAEMGAILAYIKTFWPPEQRQAQEDITRRTQEAPN